MKASIGIGLVAWIFAMTLALLMAGKAVAGAKEDADAAKEDADGAKDGADWSWEQAVGFDSRASEDYYVYGWWYIDDGTIKYQLDAGGAQLSTGDKNYSSADTLYALAQKYYDANDFESAEANFKLAKNQYNIAQLDYGSQGIDIPPPYYVAPSGACASFIEALILMEDW